VDSPADLAAAFEMTASASLPFSLADGSKHTIRFEIVERPKSVVVEVPTLLHEDADEPVNVTIIGTGDGRHQSTAATFASQYSYNCAPGELSSSGVPLDFKLLANKTLSIHKFDLPNGASGATATLPIKCTATVVERPETAVSGSKTVKIAATGGTILFAPPSVTITAGDSARVLATPVNRVNVPTNQHVTWSLRDSTEAATITQDTGNAVTLVTVSDPDHLPSNGILKLHAEVDGTSGETLIAADLPVRIVFPTGFTFVRGSLEMIDTQTAHDLYGPQTSRDFFVAKITILNDLKDDPKQHNAGASILVFSNSLAVGVNMEKNDGYTVDESKRLRESKTADEVTKLKATLDQGRRRRIGRDRVPDPDDVLWRPIESSDLRSLGLPVGYPIKIPRIRETHPPDPNEPLAIYTCDDVWYAEQPVNTDECKSGDDACISRLRKEHDDEIAAARLRQLHYRPYPYDLVVKSFDPRDNRTGRSRTFRALTFAGAAASFITGVPNFGASNEFVSVNEKFGNVLVPALAALWPNLRETQRQNLISDTMHPIEEVPFGSSLTKVVFLPKYPFQGFKANSWFRISEICPFDFQVEVAVAPKRQQATAAEPATPVVQPR